MQPKSIHQTDGLNAKSVRVETPIGAIESDSGNHLVDIGTVLIIIVLFFGARKFFQAT